MSEDKTERPIEAKLTITYDVIDVGALHGTATAFFVAAGGTPSEAEAWLGVEADPNVSACLLELHHASRIEGATHVSAEVDVIRPDVPTLREGKTVFASTGNITADELDRINASFGLEEVGGGVHRCLDDITHDGLFISPKYAGFIVRIPGHEFLAERIEELTPEMRALVEAAARQGATRIEFDADEEPAEGFHAE